MVVNNVVGLAKAAKAFGVPTILTTVLEERGGYLIQGAAGRVPRAEADRPDVHQHLGGPRGCDAVKATGRKKLIIAGLWTEICVAMPAIQAAGRGLRVRRTSSPMPPGGARPKRTTWPCRRMVQAGVVPITWGPCGVSWQRDWARETTYPG